MQCTSPIRIMKNQTSATGLLVPCGKCLACRISRRKEWSLRMLHELEEYNDAIFVTLTYSDDHLPNNFSLSKRALQLFYKRLRYSIQPNNIRYFACGEYGPKTGRPHYHSIIFGLSLSSGDKKHIMDNWPYCDWDNPVIRKKSFGLAEPDSIRYVAQYIDKKFSGPLADEEYAGKNREPVFRLSSQGIGARYVDRNCEDLQKNLSFTVQGVQHQVPRYYLKRLGMDSKSITTIAKQKDIDVVEHYTGKKASSNDFYAHGTVNEILEFEGLVTKAKKQHEANLVAKTKLYDPKL